MIRTVTCRSEILLPGIRRLSGRVLTEKEAVLKAIVGKRSSVNRFSVPFQC